MQWGGDSRERTLWTQIQGTISELKISAVLFIILIFKEMKAWGFGHWAKGHLHSCLVAQSSPTLCDPMDCSPPDSSDHGILQTRILEWVAVPSSRGSSQPRDWTWILCTVGGYFTVEPPGKPQAKDPTRTKQWWAMYPGQKATPLFQSQSKLTDNKDFMSLWQVACVVAVFAFNGKNISFFQMLSISIKLYIYCRTKKKKKDD